MGYKRIITYGDIIEVYDYEKPLKNQKGINALRAHRKVTKRYDNTQKNDVKSKRARSLREDAQRKGIYTRKESSIKRSRDNFFRLCHHNNCFSKNIDFITLTFAYDLDYKLASQHVRHFFERIREWYPSISYISVPELTKKGRFHFHLLVYDLPPEASLLERETRNLQRQFRRGYLDIRSATYTSKGIAGYMAKYMAKALTDEKYETARGYNCSRNIKKFSTIGSNLLSQYEDLILPVNNIAKIEKAMYDVPYLGTCSYKKIIKNKI